MRVLAALIALRSLSVLFSPALARLRCLAVFAVVAVVAGLPPAHAHTLPTVLTGSPTFRPRLELEGATRVMVRAGDDRIYLAGDFTSVGGQQRSGLARLNGNATVDSFWAPGPVNGFVNAFAAQADGKVLVGGLFSLAAGLPRQNLVRFNVDGSVDLSFAPAVNLGGVTTLAIQSDGKILVGGYNSTSILRLNADGSRDITFKPGTGFNDAVWGFALQANDLIVVVGQFSNYRGVEAHGIVRLMADGTRDVTFESGVGFSAEGVSANVIRTQADGKLLVGGYFTRYNNTDRQYLVRLDGNGRIDETFHTEGLFDDAVQSIELQPDGKILVGGAFRGDGHERIARLLEDGNVDVSFVTGSGFSNTFIRSLLRLADGSLLVHAPSVDGIASYNGFRTENVVRILEDGFIGKGFSLALRETGSAYAIVPTSDGKWFVGGNFSYANGVPRANLARFDSAGELDLSFALDFGFDGPVLALAAQPDGKVIVGGEFQRFHGDETQRIIRLDTFGARDATFDIGAGFTGTVFALALRPDGRVYVGGSFTSYKHEPSSVLVRLLTDGTLDPDFTLPGGGIQNGEVRALALAPGGGVYAAGGFTFFNDTLSRRLVRLTDAGARDEAFAVGEGFNHFYSTTAFALAVQPDNKVLVGGDFSTYQNVYVGHLARLLPDGRLDTVENGGSGFPAFDVLNSVRAIAVQTDGRILVGGEEPYTGSSVLFDSGTPTGPVEAPSLVRLEASGHQDTSFRVPGYLNVVTALSLGHDQFLVGSAGAMLFPARVAAGLTRLEAAPVPQIDTQPIALTPNVGTAASLSVAATGSDLAYQWYKDGKTIAGATSATLPFTPVRLTDAGLYYVVVTNAYGTVQSDTVSLSGSGTAPSITTQPESIAIQTGASGSLSVFASGVTHFQWRKLGVPIPGATSATLPLHAATLGDAALYDVLVGNNLSVIASASARVTVQPAQRIAGPLFASPAFAPNVESGDGRGSVTAVFAEADGRYYVAGAFSSVDGTPRRGLARFLADGTLDLSFIVEIASGGSTIEDNGTIGAIGRTSDGKIVIAGTFNRVNGVARSGIARLNTDGSVDQTFDPGSVFNGGRIYTLLVQPDDKIVVGGNFWYTTTSGNTWGLARFTSTGALDSGFTTAIGTGTDGSPIRALGLASDGGLFVGGLAITFNGANVSPLFRLAPDGTLKPEFAPVFHAAVLAFVVLPGDKLIVGGDFSNFAESGKSYLVGLNSDGSRDISFDPAVGSGPNGSVYSIARRTDGTLLVGGGFTRYNEVSAPYLVRLDATGGYDGSFVIGSGFSVNGESSAAVKQIAALPNGDAIVAGDFNFYQNEAHRSIARLNADGSLDAAQIARLGRSDGVVNVIIPAPDGKWLVAGNFGAINGRPAKSIMRLNADGSIDQTYYTAGGPVDPQIYALAVQGDGKILVGGQFRQFDDYGTPVSVSNLVRLNPNGTLDRSFNIGTGFDYSVYALAVQADGKILVGGDFDYLGYDSTPHLVRLLPDGTRDTSFSPGYGPSSTVRSIVVLPGSRILVGGDFSYYDDEQVNNFVRLTDNGERDPSFSSHGVQGYYQSIYTMLVQPDGRILVGGRFYYAGDQDASDLARFLPDGALDEGFEPPYLGGWVYGLALQSDGRIIVAGDFRFKGASGSSSDDLIRLYSNGAYDPTFSSPFQGSTDLRTIALNPNGRLTIGGGTLYSSIDRHGLIQIDGSVPEDLDVASFSPGVIAPGLPVILTGTGFVNVTGVFFNGVPAANFFVDSSHQITAFPPNGVTGGAITVQVGPLVASTAGSYTVTQLPVITGFTPLSGATKRMVRINGANFFSGGTSGPIVRFNGTQATLGLTYHNNSIVVAVPEGAASGPISVTTGFGTATSQTTFTVVPSAAAPANDFFAGAATLSPAASGNLMGTTAYATRESGEPQHAGNAGGASVWFKWTPATSGRTLFYTGYAGLGDFGASLVVYTGSAVGGLTPVASGGAGGVYLTYNSAVYFQAQAGTTYYIALEGFDGVTGDYNLTWSPLGLPTIEGFGPSSSVYAGQSFYIQGTNFVPGSRVYVGGVEVPSKDIFVSSPSFISISRLPYASGGGYVQVITTPFDSAADPSNLTVITPPPAPTITSFSPTNGVPGTLVRINGTALALGDIPPVVSFGGVPVTAGISESSTQLFVTVPVGAITGSISVRTTAGSTASTQSFTIAGPPAIDQQPSTIVASIGDERSLSVTASSLLGVTYQWYHDGQPIAGATSATLNFSSLQSPDAGEYRVVVTSPAGSVSSNTAFVTGDAASPVITTAPSDLTVTTGANASLSVVASNSTYYQWRRNGVPIAGANGPVHLISPARRVDADLYDVVVYNGLVRMISSAARLAVAPTSYPGLVVSDPAGGLVFEDERSAVVKSVITLSDDSILAVGNFVSIDGVRRSSVAKFTTAGLYDTSFNAPAFDGEVVTAAQQHDGKIVVGGRFNIVGTSQHLNIVRLNADGSIDETFGTAFDSAVQVVKMQVDDKILVGGSFFRVNNESQRGLARIMPSGSADPTFSVTLDGDVAAIALREMDNQIVIGGGFFNVNGSARSRLARINSSGVIDSDFVPNPDGQVLSLAIHPSQGTIFVGGFFNNIAGHAQPYLARLKPTGEFDSGFMPTIQGGAVKTIAFQYTGSSILIGGYFGTVNNVSRTQFARVNYDGTLDGRFNLSVDNSVESIVTYTADKIVIGGWFTHVAGQTHARIARLNVDGDPDTTFVVSSMRAVGSVRAALPSADGGFIFGGGFTHIDGTPRRGLARVTAAGVIDPSFHPDINGSVSALARTGDGSILFGGSFSHSVDLPLSGLGRLRPDGSIDSAFTPSINGNVNAIVVQPNGRIVLGGSFGRVGNADHAALARLNADGTVDGTFTTGANGEVRALARQRDGRLIVAGQFSSLGGVERNNVGRLNLDNTTDPSFAPNPNSSVQSVAIQADGKILIGGFFFQVNGTSVPGIARYFAEGTRDSDGFIPSTSFGGSVQSLLLQEDGKVLVAGNFSFSTGASGQTSFSRLLRLTTSGVRDTSFSASVGSNFPSAQALVLTDSGQLWAGGYEGTGRALVKLLPAGVPSITNPPVAQVTTVGGSVTFNVTATGTPAPTYQWFFNGTALAGKTGSSLTVENVTLANVGNYVVRVSNSFGSVNSTPVSIFGPAEPPTIATQPVGGTVTSGVSVNLFVTANPTGASSGPLTYQWFRFGAPIAGATNANYYVDSIRLTDDDVYSVRVADGLSVSTSNAVRVVVAPSAYPNGLRMDAAFAGSVGFDPETMEGVGDLTLLPGGDILVTGQFSTVNNAAAIGFARLHADGTRDTAFASGAGLTNTSGRTPSVSDVVALPDGRIVIAGDFNTYNGTAVPGIVRLLPNGDRDTSFNFAGTGLDGGVQGLQRAPGGRLLIAGFFRHYNGIDRPGLARLNSDGTLDLSFDPGTGVGMSGNMETFLQLPDGKLVIGGRFSLFNGVSRAGLVRLNANGSVDTDFDVGTGPALSGEPGEFNDITVQPDGKLLVTGDFDAFNGQSRPGVVRLLTSGAVDPSLVPTPAPNGFIGRAVGQADGRVVLLGGFFGLGGSPIPPTPLLRYLANGAIDTDAAIYGLQNAEISAALQLDDGSVLLGGSNFLFEGQSPTGLVKLRAAAARQITTQPKDIAVTAGNSATFSVAASGDAPITYQWYRNGDIIPTATSASYILQQAKVEDNGAKFTVIVTNVAGALPSEKATLTVNAPVFIQTPPAFEVANLGQRVVFSVAATSPAPLTYQWRRNGEIIEGATSATYTIDTVQAGHFGSYTVTVSSGVDSVTTQPVQLSPVTQGIALFNARVFVPTNGSGTASFTIEGTQSKTILLRVGGPALTAMSVDGALSDPRVRLVDRTGAVLATNDNWQSAANAGAIQTTASSLAAFPFATGSADAAILTTLAPGTYTAVFEGTAGGSGLALVEVFDADTDARPRLPMMAVRGVVGRGDKVVTWSFSVNGTVPKKFLIRAQGSAFAGSYDVVTGLALDTELKLYQLVAGMESGSGWSQIASNQTWYVQGQGGPSIPALNAAVALAGATEFSGVTDPALLVTLQPGYYTLTASLQDPHLPEGQALLEIFEVDNARAAVAAPTIIHMTPDSTAREGGSVSFAVEVIGKPAASYQWRRNGVNILNANSPLLYLPFVNRDDAIFNGVPVRYDVVITSGDTTLTSPQRSFTVFHSGDSDKDYRISIFEITRVLELYNYRESTVRTGAYHTATGTEDGYTLGAGAIVVYHSADSNRDGRIDLSELTRMIDLYNHRDGTIRTGAYQPQNGTEDNFTPGRYQESNDE